MRIANFEKRLFAYLFDLFLSSLFSFLLISFVYNGFTIFYSFVLGEIFATVFYLLTTVPLMVLTNGYTIGGALVGIHTISVNESKMTFSLAISKMLGLSLFPLAFINGISMLIIHEPRTIFDKYTETIVVNKTCY